MSVLYSLPVSILFPFKGLPSAISNVQRGLPLHNSLNEVGAAVVGAAVVGAAVVGVAVVGGGVGVGVGAAAEIETASKIIAWSTYKQISRVEQNNNRV